MFTIEMSETHAEPQYLWVSRHKKTQNRPEVNFAAFSGSQKVGYALLLWTEDSWWLEHFWVEPQIRGQGVGTQLLEAVCEWSNDMDVDVWLRVEADPKGSMQNPELSGWYAHHGFVPVDTNVMCR